MPPAITADDYDTPWKGALEHAFPEFMAFYFPDAACHIDWSRGHVFLDKELRQIVRGAELGRRHVDKLVRVHRFDGREDWIAIHVEVQGQHDDGFAKRMFGGPRVRPIFVASLLQLLARAPCGEQVDT